ncbi:hypothetical protein [Candidatus Venteria ishoeyi]|uniref:Uncharacterized protein n=1 Tax=Candidatus Venteria ishoeyi TaxID=1899563 RepID=A0A1H6FCT6_9GAMM|nr:hypothetical protein [Candidatus Venteria ishoeyi]MDM8547483.1 hypothetical protein [Candidatus Venteria ishoeyi]SEH06825.1 Uncharacterised protein [Candidatus Venteria ishoeyi]
MLQKNALACVVALLLPSVAFTYNTGFDKNTFDDLNNLFNEMDTNQQVKILPHLTLEALMNISVTSASNMSKKTRKHGLQ